MRHAFLNVPILIKVDDVVRRTVGPDMAVERLFGLLRRDVRVLGVTNELGGFVQHVPGSSAVCQLATPTRSDGRGLTRLSMITR